MLLRQRRTAVYIRQLLGGKIINHADYVVVKSSQMFTTIINEFDAILYNIDSTRKIPPCTIPVT